MSKDSSEQRPKSVFMYAAEVGVPMGLYLTAMSMCLLASLKFPGLPVLVLPLMCGVPVVLYFLMRRVRDTDERCRRVSSLWLMGIYTFIFGSLICALVSDLYVMFAEPHFVRDYVALALQELESAPDPSQFASQTDLLRSALNSHALPGNMQFIASMGWATCFAGSLLSLITAAILAPRRPRPVSGF